MRSGVCALLFEFAAMVFVSAHIFCEKILSTSRVQSVTNYRAGVIQETRKCTMNVIGNRKSTIQSQRRSVVFDWIGKDYAIQENRLFGDFHDHNVLAILTMFAKHASTQAVKKRAWEAIDHEIENRHSQCWLCEQWAVLISSPIFNSAIIVWSKMFEIREWRCHWAECAKMEGTAGAKLIANFSTTSADTMCMCLWMKKMKTQLNATVQISSPIGPMRIHHSSHHFATQSSHSVDRAGWQAKMASIEFWIPWHNAHRPHWYWSGVTTSMPLLPSQGDMLTTVLGPVRIWQVNVSKIKCNGSHLACHPALFKTFTMTELYCHCIFYCVPFDPLKILMQFT